EGLLQVPAPHWLSLMQAVPLLLHVPERPGWLMQNAPGVAPPAHVLPNRTPVLGSNLLGSKTLCPKATALFWLSRPPFVIDKETCLAFALVQLVSELQRTKSE